MDDPPSGRSLGHIKEASMRRFLILPPALALVLLALGAAPANSRHLKVTLQPVNGSGISGFAILEGLPHEKGTVITVHATGLTPGTEYLSLYYGNHTCELEPYSPQDVIGHYVGASDGTGNANGRADDDLDKINSVSVRLASDFSLKACGDVHP
jgi:hypothetical protein